MERRKEGVYGAQAGNNISLRGACIQMASLTTNAAVDFFMDVTALLLPDERCPRVYRERPQWRLDLVQEGDFDGADFSVTLTLGDRLDVKAAIGFGSGAKALVNWPGCGATNALMASAILADWSRVASRLAMLCARFNAAASAYASDLLTAEAAAEFRKEFATAIADCQEARRAWQAEH
jgi:hypothetical protein